MQWEQRTYANPAIVEIAHKHHFTGRNKRGEAAPSKVAVMTTLNATARKARKFSLVSVLASIADRIRTLRARWAAERKALVRARAAHHAAVLSAMTDEQLAGWGLKREDIIAHAYKNVPKD